LPDLTYWPAARLYHRWPDTNLLDTWFYSIQAIELLAGGVNLSLMALNIRDGVQMVRTRSKSAESKG
jgi:hypothetical protein